MTNYIKVNIKPLSLNQLKKKYPDLFCEQNWYKNEAFAKKKPKQETLYIRTDIVPDSIDKTDTEQEKLLDKGSFVPTINQLVQMAIAYYKQTGKKWTTDYWLRTSSVTAEGYRVDLYDIADGLSVSYWFDYAHSRVGVAEAKRQFNTVKATVPTFTIDMKILQIKVNGKVYSLDD